MEKPQQPPLTLLIDANNLVCRIYYAVVSDILRKNAKNLPEKTSPYYHYMKKHLEEVRARQLYYTVHTSLHRNLQHIIMRYQPHYIMAAIDSEENFRKELHRAYKKKSSGKPQLLQEIIKELPEIMRQMDILPLGAFKYEADDVIATLATRAPGQTIIYSQDHDLFSILSQNIHILAKSGLINEQKFIKRYGMLPERLPLYKALVGDSSDRMPGIRYFRQNREVALYIVTHFRTSGALFRNLRDLPADARQSLKSVGQMNLEKRVKLHTLCTQAPVTEL